MVTPWAQLPRGGGGQQFRSCLFAPINQEKAERDEGVGRSRDRELAVGEGDTQAQRGRGRRKLEVPQGRPSARSPLAHPPPACSRLLMPVPRSCAPAAGSALETWGGEPPSHHPYQRHLCHAPPMSQQRHEPDQEPTGAAQQQCQRPLHSLCKLPPPPQALRKEGEGRDVCGTDPFVAGGREWGGDLVQPPETPPQLPPCPPAQETGNHFPRIPQLGGQRRGGDGSSPPHGARGR